MDYVPQQVDGCYCGVFTCMFALLLYVDRPLSFDQKLFKGQECRNRIGLSILIVYENVQIYKIVKYVIIGNNYFLNFELRMSQVVTNFSICVFLNGLFCNLPC